MSLFKKATKQQAKLRLALAGPAGSGKTFTSLLIAQSLAQSEGGRVAVIDTENGSASKYADLFDFDAVSLTASSGFAPERYLEMLREAESAGYPVIVMDSLSHEWAGKDGILEAVDQAASQSNGNKFVAWGRVTPRHDKLVRAIVESPAHIVCTLRAKMEYVQERNERGRTEIRAVGMKPIQRDELEYEFDVYGLLEQDNRLIVRKSRCPQLSGAVIEKPGTDVARVLIDWLSSGEARAAVSDRPLAPPSADALAEDQNAVPTSAVSDAESSTRATTPISVDQRVADSAVLTGANPEPIDFQCADCNAGFRKNDTVNIQKNARGARVDVLVSEFHPVCVERLSAFFCGKHYDKRYWKTEQTEEAA